MKALAISMLTISVVATIASRAARRLANPPPFALWSDAGCLVLRRGHALAPAERGLRHAPDGLHGPPARWFGRNRGARVGAPRPIRGYPAGRKMSHAIGRTAAGIARAVSNPAWMPVGGPRTSPRAGRQLPLEHRILMTATLCLLAVGAVMVYSASSPLGAAQRRRQRHRLPDQVTSASARSAWSRCTCSSAAASTLLDAAVTPS